MAGAYHSSDATVSARRAAAIATTDAATYIPATRSIYVGVSGNITATMAEDEADVLFSNVPVGVFPIQVIRVKATGTTATNLVALW